MSEAWFGEPTVDSDGRLWETRTCNGMVISGGVLVHSHSCPIHGSVDPDASPSPTEGTPT